MDSKIKLIDEFITQIKKLEYDEGQLDAIKIKAKMLINKFFGEKSYYLEELKHISFSPIIITSSTPYSRYHESFYDGKNKLINLFNVIHEDLSLDDLPVKISENKTKYSNIQNNKIFIVHGHNEEMKISVARTLEKLGLNPIILHEQPNKGKTIIEKFIESSDIVSFAIILLSADDIAYNKNTDSTNAKFRARQNVILELGYFIGKLGREKVIALFEENSNLEIPSDYAGVLFTPFDKNGKWQYDIVKELRENGLNIDANKII